MSGTMRLPEGEPETPSLEERKFLKTNALAERELDLREREVAAKEAESTASKWLSPTAIGLFAAATGLLGNLVVAFIGDRNSQEVEHSRAQSSLIIQAVSTGNAQTACANLNSFVRLGLLDDPKGTISNCASALNTIPVLPAVRVYTPVADVPSAAALSATVTSIDAGASYHLEISFTVPPKIGSITEFDILTVYAYQVDAMGNRSNDLGLPTIHGHWLTGDRVSFFTDINKGYVDDQTHKPYLRFCIGTPTECIPGPNLLLAAR